MSRARLGLYVFARVSLFKNCFELQPAFNILMKRPMQLHICPNELYPGSRQASVTAPNPVIVYDMPMMSKFVIDFYQDKVKQLNLIQARKLAAKAPGDIKTAAKTGATRQHPGDGGDSDDETEEESKQPELKVIENEVLEGSKKVVSAENKAAAALEKVLGEPEEMETDEQTTTTT